MRQLGYYLIAKVFPALVEYYLQENNENIPQVTQESSLEKKVTSKHGCYLMGHNFPVVHESARKIPPEKAK